MRLERSAERIKQFFSFFFSEKLILEVTLEIPCWGNLLWRSLLPQENNHGFCMPGSPKYSLLHSYAAKYGTTSLRNWENINEQHTGCLCLMNSVGSTIRFLKSYKSLYFFQWICPFPLFSYWNLLIVASSSPGISVDFLGWKNVFPILLPWTRQQVQARGFT